MIPVMLGNSFADLENQPLLDLIMDWHQQGVLLASACAGSFLLAASGVLDGKSATTHWTLADTFRRTFPLVLLNEGELLVENPAGANNSPGGILCGGGMTAYIDVALALISQTGGNALAARIGRILIWDPHRPRQAAYAEADTHCALPTGEIILKSQAWAMVRIAQNFTLPDWAGAAGLEVRSFERRFRKVQGQSPGVWLRQKRLDLARELVATTARTWEEISAACGYQDPGGFRQYFRRTYGLNPRDYRQRFGVR